MELQEHSRLSSYYECQQSKHFPKQIIRSSLKKDLTCKTKIKATNTYIADLFSSPLEQASTALSTIDRWSILSKTASEMHICVR